MTLIRFLNITVVAALVLAAVYVYKIKFEATVRAAQVDKLREDIRHEHDQIAALRAEWSRLDSPNRIQRIVTRHLPLRPVNATQFDTFDHLPTRPPEPGASEAADPIATIIENMPADDTTGSVRVPAQAR
jgi:cell division protein FtsL